MKKILYSLFLLALVAIWSGCDDFLDINSDPNNPTDVPLNQLLPSVQVDMSGAFGTSVGGLSQITSTYMHQFVQRGTTINDYGIQSNDFGVTVPWEISYNRALTDINIMIEKGTAEESWHYVAVAQIMRAYIFSILVDIYADVPFEEANLGAINLNPSYDLGENIYPQLFNLLDSGLLNIEREVAIGPQADDLIYGGDMSLWRKFAKTLKLKMYTQIRLVEDVSAEVTSLISEGDLIGSAAEDFELVHGTSQLPDDRNPAYVDEYLNPRYYISPFFYEVMRGQSSFFESEKSPFLGIEDPRIPYYFYNQLGTAEDPENPTSYFNATTRFLSIYAFSFNIDPNEGFDQAASQTVAGLYPLGGSFDEGVNNPVASAPNVSYDIGDPQVPQRLLTYYARKYLEAELALVGVGPGDDRALLEEAIVASFAKVNQIAALASRPAAPQIPDSTITQYTDRILDIYDGGDDELKLQIIMTQKWIASFGWGPDLYTDYRRTGYPLLHDGNTDNLNVTVRGRDFPFSFPWPNTSIELNSNAPAQKRVALDAARVFWDVN